MRIRPRLATILLGVNLFTLLVSFGGIYVFHIYDNQLVRQVESDLISQGAYISAVYGAAIGQVGGETGGQEHACGSVAPDPGEGPGPVLNLASDVIGPSRPEAQPPAQPPDPVALQAGQRAFPVLAEATHATLAGFRIVDCHGTVVAGRNEVGQTLASVPEVSAALQGRYQAAIRIRTTDNPHPPLASISRGANIRVFAALPIRRDGRVIGAVLLSRTPRNIAESLYDQRQAVLVAVPVVLALTSLLALLTSLAISRPIHALIGQAQRIGRGEKDVPPLARPVTREIAQLSQTLVAMGDTLARRSAYLRDFAAHMSHEFKTPLTAIQGAVELIREHSGEMSAEQLDRFLANTIKDTERLKLLVTRLLELARADMMQPEGESCDLAELLPRAGSLAGQPMRIALEAPAGPLRVRLSEDVIRAVLATLIGNAAQHGASEVVLHVAREEGHVRLTVRDNGAGISPANAAKLFTPFFTTRRDSGGTGLGLVIVRSMLAACHADISHRPGGPGASFVVSLPHSLEEGRKGS